MLVVNDSKFLQQMNNADMMRMESVFRGDETQQTYSRTDLWTHQLQRVIPYVMITTLCIDSANRRRRSDEGRNDGLF